MLKIYTNITLMALILREQKNSRRPGIQPHTCPVTKQKQTYDSELALVNNEGISSVVVCQTFQ